MEEDQICVACRVRPRNTSEYVTSGSKSFYSIEQDKQIVIDTKVDQKSFNFDYVAHDNVTQQEFFQQTGVPISEACLQGFNGTVIFYGQTGNIF